ncbi:MAG: hypothetical protein AB7O73_09260 [Bacteroidia bacterium]
MANYSENLYTANMGLATMTTGNSNLDGSTGTYYSVLTGSTNGTLIKTLIIKAQQTTSLGMIRVFAQKSGLSSNLLAEYFVPDVVQSGIEIAYQNVIPLNYTLENGETLYMSTENSETFNVIAEAFDISFATGTTYLGSTIQFIANAGSGNVNTANSNLDGSTGTYSTIFTAASGGGTSGAAINSIVIKAQQTTSLGMVRLFIVDTSGMNPGVLFSEVFIPSVVQSSVTKTFSYQALSGTLCLPPGYSIMASTENSETFSIVIDGSDWQYV